MSDYSKMKKDELIAELEMRDKIQVNLESVKHEKNAEINELQSQLDTFKKQTNTDGVKDMKNLNITNSAELTEKVNDVEIFGNPDTWELICKASSKSQGWMKSCKVMTIKGVGLIVQVSTQQGDNVAEAIELVPNAKVKVGKDGNKEIVRGIN